jgi:hypothetical protein
VVDVPTYAPMVRFGMARFCPTCDLIHQQQSCPKCDGSASVDLREMMARPKLGPSAERPVLGTYRLLPRPTVVSPGTG